jgi:hypothetical protein
MQAAQFVLPDCFTCIKKLGEVRKMQPCGNGAYWCPTCKNVKQLDNRMALHPMGILSAASLPALNVLYVTAMYLYRNWPIELQIGMGGLLFTGYLLKGLKALGR